MSAALDQKSVSTLPTHDIVVSAVPVSATVGATRVGATTVGATLGVVAPFMDTVSELVEHREQGLIMQQICCYVISVRHIIRGRFGVEQKVSQQTQCMFSILVKLRERCISMAQRLLDQHKVQGQIGHNYYPVKPVIDSVMTLLLQERDKIPPDDMKIIHRTWRDIEQQAGLLSFVAAVTDCAIKIQRWFRGKSKEEKTADAAHSKDVLDGYWLTHNLVDSIAKLHKRFSQIQVEPPQT